MSPSLFSALRPLLLLGFVLALALPGCGRPPEPARHLVLVTVDTWRGDHFDSERAGTPLTPELARFADSGLRFPDASSVASETAPGIAGILTGLVPRRSGVLANPYLLQPEVPSLATILDGAGFTTAAVVANPVLRGGKGYDQGFEHYDLMRPRDASKEGADRVTDAALARVDALPLAAEGRLFLWVHYLDPHGPYRPPEATRRLFPVDAFEADRDIPLLPPHRHGGFGGIPAYQQTGQSPPSRDGRDYLARYAAEVRFTDGEVARLLEGLAERGILDRAVVVLSSDHGEALDGEHGYYFSHGNGPTQDQLHVPLVVRWPGCPAGETVERPVSTVDVMPTVLARLGVPAPEGHGLDGTDLLEGGRHVIHGEARHKVWLRDGEWKATWRAKREARLFRLGDDPGELRDLAAEHPDRLEALARRLREVRRLEALVEPRSQGRLSRREQQELRALGYL